MLQFVPARCLALIAIACFFAVGCSRERFRQRADKDVEAIITQKNIFPQWQVKNWHVYPDQRARFADPFKPDAPPFPVDDYAAQLVSPNPQKPGKGGVGRFEGDGYLKQIAEWDAQNRSATGSDSASSPDSNAPSRTDTREESEYKAAFATDERPYRLTQEQSVELALFNSREFQDRREDLYLAALPVSLERFGFTPQVAAAENLVYSIGGQDSNAPGSRWTAGTSFGLTQRLSSGAALLVSLANQVVVNVGNGRPTIGVSDIGLTLSQPFLRGGGFAVALESLTQAERTLLYALRSYARFRNLFYLAIVGGGNIGYTNNPYGLQGLAANLGRGVGANLTANAVGYLPTVLRAAVLANERKNVEAIESYLGLFQNLKEGNAVPELQVVRVEQRLVQSRALVLQRTQEYRDSLDNFKLQLGVPATLPIELNESPLQPIRKQLQRFESVYRELEALELAAANFDAKQPPATYRERWRKLLTESALVRGTPFSKAYPQTSEVLAKLTPAELQARVDDAEKRRQKLLDDRADRQANRQPPSDAVEREIQLIENERDAARFEQALRRYESQAWLRSPVPRQLAEQTQAFRAALDAGMLLAVVARTQRIDEIRNEWPTLPGVPVSGTDVLTASLDEASMKVAEAALNNRYDLMNARAQVVDSWRRVNVAANALQGVFDVEYDLRASSPPNADRPFSVGGSRTLNQVRLRLEPPFVRRAERNAYRAALISYQRQRRSLQAVEDNIVTDARSNLRALRQLAQNFKVQQKAVELAYITVDNARSQFTAPADPQARDTAGNSAALTQQLLDAQQQLVQAQNQLYTIWTNYLTTRMELFLDLELFTLDDRGVWIDDSARPAPEYGPAPAPTTTPTSAVPRTGDGVGVGLVAPLATEHTGTSGIIRPVAGLAPEPPRIAEGAGVVAPTTHPPTTGGSEHPARVPAPAIERKPEPELNPGPTRQPNWRPVR